MTEPAWLADPTGRHQTRYWNGGEWTDHVADNGVVGVDPPTMPPPPPMGIVPTPFAAPTPHVPSAPPQAASRKWWIVAVPILVLALIVAVIASRDSKKSGSAGGAGASSGGGVSGTSVRVEFTDTSGYQYVVEHTGAVHLQRSITNVSPGFEVVHVVGGKLSVVNANEGRNAPMPDVQLVAYVPVPDCAAEQTVLGNSNTEVSLPESCFIESVSNWSTEADIANGLGSVDNLERILAPGQTAVAAVDESWLDEGDLRSAVPDTVDVSGPFVWGIEVADHDAFGGPTSCVIRLVGSNGPLLQQLADSVAEINRDRGLGEFTCAVAPA